MLNKLLKKSFLVILVLMSGLFVSTIDAATSKTTNIYVHYYRFDNNYAPWDLWIWQSKPESLEGQAYSFSEDDTNESYNFGGVVSMIELTGTIADATEFGIIVRKPDWSAKDIDNDRFFSVSETSENGNQHIYLVQGDPLIGYALNDPDGPSKSPKFTQSFFTKTDEISFKTTEMISADKITLRKDDIIVEPKSISINDKSGVITLNEPVDFGSKYELIAVFSDDSVNTITVTFDGIYDSAEFENAFYYDGDDLGAHVTDTKTTFRLWAPISSAVQLNLYSSGTTVKDGGTTDTPTRVIDMVADVNGTFYYEENANLHNTYYTFSVTNGQQTFEVVDPYAYSTGVNGNRGLVIDFDQVNPAGFTYDSRANNIENNTDAIIYELQVRDLTTHSSWNGTEVNRGRFLGLIEKGTTFNNQKTGFDHILDLGITHIQLLPFFDFGVVDETKLDDEDYNAFNWGYMPLHFNVPEGSFSSNPYDGLTRVNELKQVTMAYTENNIRLNMDVVYNHTGLSADSNFNQIIPGYYHRKTETGAFSNGSGTGNETASERVMVRKFIVDSVLFWATEYNISGFRFDLMALHDISTMNELNDALHEIDPTIMVYGEPWMGGTSTLPALQQAGKENLDQMGNIGAFNDDFRDAVKGSVFNREYPGFVNGEFSSQVINRVKYGIVGGVEHDALTLSGLSQSKAWHGDPNKTINYVTAHDNNTLHDKLYLTNEITNQLDNIDEMVMQAYSILLTSQGVMFIHAGDEILRSKPNASGEGFDHNSYQSPDSVNQIRWDQKSLDDNLKVYNHIKGLIALRKSDDSFRLSTAAEINQAISFHYEAIKGLISYQISDGKEILVIHNANDKVVKLVLPKDSGWDVVVSNEGSGTETITSYKGGAGIKVAAHESLILYKNESTENVSSFQSFMNTVNGFTTIDAETPQPSLLWLVILVPAVVLLAVAGGVVLIVIKKKK